MNGSTAYCTDVICLVGISEGPTFIYTNLNGTVHNLKRHISNQYEFLEQRYMQLKFNSIHLEDDKLLSDYNIRQYSTINIVYGGELPCLLMDNSLFDPQYNHDFTHERDDGTVFYRGGHLYKPPYGWNRIALRVKGKYENNVWLGADGYRTDSSPGEWAVSYHGTNQLGIKGIVETGYDSRRLERDLFGKGHYSTPDIKVAAKYAIEFECSGKNYLMVLQNRVDLTKSKTIPKEVTRAGAEYFMTPLRDNIRLMLMPYALKNAIVRNALLCNA